MYDKEKDLQMQVRHLEIELKMKTKLLDELRDELTQVIRKNNLLPSGEITRGPIYYRHPNGVLVKRMV